MILALAALIASVAVAPLQDKGLGRLDGTYEVRFIEAAGKSATRQDPRTTPPGQIRRFIVAGKRCAMIDMMVGFQGTLAQKGKLVTVKFTEGPSGKMPKPDVIQFALKREKGQTTLVQTSPTRYPRIQFVRISTKPLIKLPY